MTTWRVLKQAQEGPNSRIEYHDVGTHETDNSFYLGFHVPQEIGEQFGAGEYLLIGEDRAKTLRIGVREEFYELEDAPPEVEAESAALIEEIEVSA